MPQPNYPVTRCQAITNLINSVAKEQEALADILEKVNHGPRSGKTSGCYSEYEEDATSRFPHPPHDKEDEEVELINAITRLEFILAFKTSLFIDCACPKNGCRDTV